jgi:hypothetical protein
MDQSEQLVHDSWNTSMCHTLVVLCKLLARMSARPAEYKNYSLGAPLQFVCNTKKKRRSSEMTSRFLIFSETVARISQLQTRRRAAAHHACLGHNATKAFWYFF